MITDADIVARMAKGWSSGETECGTGSFKSRTGHVREWLKLIVEKYNFRVINDAGAGDLNWISLIKWDVDFQGYDIYPRHPDVIKLDTTRGKMRPCDVILCRQVMIHLPKDRIHDMIKLFRETSDYLIATNYHTINPKWADYDHDFHHVRLTDDEFGLGEPIEKIQDTNNLNDLAMWKIK